MPERSVAFARFLSREELVVFVPALQQLFGTMDVAVGHYRRYTPDTLRPVLEQNGFRIRQVDWMNLLSIPGWFLNGRVFKRSAVPALQLKVYDAIMPLVARLESLAMRLPIGMNLFTVAEAVLTSADALANQT